MLGKKRVDHQISSAAKVHAIIYNEKVTENRKFIGRLIIWYHVFLSKTRFSAYIGVIIRVITLIIAKTTWIYCTYIYIYI